VKDILKNQKVFPQSEIDIVYRDMFEIDDYLYEENITANENVPEIK
jgi:hypothetical protein